MDHLFGNHFSGKMKKSGSRNMVREIWFEKSGLKKMVLQTWIFFLVQEKWLNRKKWVYTINPQFFQVGEKWFCKLRFFSCSRKVVDQKKSPSLKNHFSRTTFL